MIKKCKWCKRKYDTSKGETSLYCVSNPNREQNKKYKKLKPNIVRIGVMVMPRNPFTEQKAKQT